MKRIFNFLKKKKKMLKAGEKVRMLTNQWVQNGVVKGDIGTVISGTNINNGNVVINFKGHNSLHVYADSVELYLVTKENIEKSISDLEVSIKTEKAKLDWMDKTKSKEFNADEFKIWRVLECVDDVKMTQMDKVKAIANLIKN